MVGVPQLGFLGTSAHVVDKKNRVFVAKRFQQLLPQDESGHRTAVLAASTGGECLWLFSPAGFRAEIDAFNTGTFAEDLDLQRQRDFFEYVAEVSLDTSGRLLIPQDLKDLAGIKENVVMLGLLQRVEIWSAEHWEARPRGKSSPRTGHAPREGAH